MAEQRSVLQSLRLVLQRVPSQSLLVSGSSSACTHGLLVCSNSRHSADLPCTTDADGLRMSGLASKRQIRTMFRWAMYMVMTRSLSMPTADGSSTELVMSPLLDLLNHDSSALPFHMAQDSDGLRALQVVTHKEMSKREEVVVSYSFQGLPKCNSHLLTCKWPYSRLERGGSSLSLSLRVYRRLWLHCE